jgi:opacity protein-like surface antigen
MKRLLVMAIFALFFVTTSAQAENKGMYFSGNAGVSFLFDSDDEYPGVPGGTFETSYDPGFNIAGAVGYDYGNIRAEGEIAYRSNDVDESSLPGIVSPASGSVSALSFMVNGYYDVHTPNFSLVPYIGGGIGVAYVNADFSVSGVPFSPFVDDSATVFAYQFMLGFGVEVSPTITLTGGYRYFATTEPSFDDSTGIPPTNFESEYRNHEVNFGVRVAF